MCQPLWDRTNNEWRYYVQKDGQRRPSEVARKNLMIPDDKKTEALAALRLAGWCPAASTDMRTRRRSGPAAEIRPAQGASATAAAGSGDENPVVLDVSRPQDGPERLGVVFTRVSEFFPKGHFAACKGGKLLDGKHLRSGAFLLLGGERTHEMWPHLAPASRPTVVVVVGLEDEQWGLAVDQWGLFTAETPTATATASPRRGYVHTTAQDTEVRVRELCEGGRFVTAFLPCGHQGHRPLERLFALQATRHLREALEARDDDSAGAYTLIAYLLDHDLANYENGGHGALVYPSGNGKTAKLVYQPGRGARNDDPSAQPVDDTDWRVDDTDWRVAAHAHIGRAPRSGNLALRTKQWKQEVVCRHPLSGFLGETRLRDHNALLLEAVGGDVAWAREVVETVAVESTCNADAVPNQRHTAGALALQAAYEELRAQVIVSAAVYKVLGMTDSVPGRHFDRYVTRATLDFLALERQENARAEKTPRAKVTLARRVGLEMTLNSDDALHTVNIGSTCIHEDTNPYEAMSIGRMRYSRMVECLRKISENVGPATIAHLLNYETSWFLARSESGNVSGFRQAQGLPKKPELGWLQEALKPLALRADAGISCCTCAHCQRAGAAVTADVTTVLDVLGELADEEEGTDRRFRHLTRAKHGGLSDTVLLNSRVRSQHDGHTISVLSLGRKGPVGPSGSAALGGMHGVVEPRKAVLDGLNGEIENLERGGSSTPLQEDRAQLKNFFRMRGGGGGSGSNRNPPKG